MEFGQSAGNYNSKMKPKYSNSLGSPETIRETYFQSKSKEPRTEFLFNNYYQQLSFIQNKIF